MWIDNFDDFIDYIETDELDDLILSVGYTNVMGEYNEFDITDITESEQYGEKYIDAFCINKDGEYEGIQCTFKICRFDSIEVNSDEE